MSLHPRGRPSENQRRRVAGLVRDQHFDDLFVEIRGRFAKAHSAAPTQRRRLFGHARSVESPLGRCEVRPEALKELRGRQDFGRRAKQRGDRHILN